jgi:hypothetical protein
MDAPLNALIAAVGSARLLRLRSILGVLLMLGVVFPAVWSRHPARRNAAYRILALLTVETSNAPDTIEPTVARTVFSSRCRERQPDDR